LIDRRTGPPLAFSFPRDFFSRPLSTAEAEMCSEFNMKDSIAAYDAIPLLDTEYNHPVVQAEVLQLIEAEMHEVPKRDYLKDLPYPKLKFASSPAFQAEYEKVKSKNRESNSDTGADYRMDGRLQMSRYDVAAPTGDMEDNPQAWREAIINARAQHEHQQNRLLNLELELTHGESIWQAHSVSLEGLVRSTAAIADSMERQKNELNSARLQSQRAAMPLLGRLVGKKNETLARTSFLHEAIASKKRKLTR
jgi:hypothetical protein